MRGGQPKLRFRHEDLEVIPALLVGNVFPPDTQEKDTHGADYWQAQDAGNVPCV